MIITGTSDKIQFKLGSTAATELPFTVDYNNYTATGVTLVSNNGTSNDTTAVDLVPSPSSGQQNELRYCSIFNADSSSETVIVQVFDGTNTRVVFRATLGVGDTLQYQLEKGWEVLDSLGNKETYNYQVLANTMKGTLGWRPGGAGTAASLLSNAVYMTTLGKADKEYTSIDVIYNVTTAASSVTWAEMAIYVGQRFNSDHAIPFRRVGFTDVNNAAGFTTSTGVKRTTISTSGIKIGDQILLVYGNSATTVAQLRTFGWIASTYITTDISDSTFGSFGTYAGVRPSLNPVHYWGAFSQQLFWFNWQGT